MNIGIDIRNIGKKRTGDEVVFFNLVKNLALIDGKNNYQLFTNIIDQEILIKIKKSLGMENRSNFEIISLKTRNKFSWNFWALPNYLRKNPLDIYLTQYITPFFVPKKIKIITIIHDVSFRVFPRMIKLSDLFFLRMLIPLAIWRSARVIGVSRFTRDEIIKYYHPKQGKADYIYNAVSTDFLQKKYSEKEVEEIRKKYHLPKKFILYLGTMQPRKNIPILIEAYAKIKKRLPDVSLVLAGGKKHNYDLNIDRKIQKYKFVNSDVLFTDFISEEDKKALIGMADCFCFPSLYEGFGIPILEAFSCKTPCVVSGIPPHFEIAKNAALFFIPYDAQNLAEKIFQVLTKSDLREELIRKGEEQTLFFSWQKTTKKMMRIFEEVFRST